MPTIATESTFELAAIQHLQAVGYRHLVGGHFECDLHTVILKSPLRDYLRRRA